MSVIRDGAIFVTVQSWIKGLSDLIDSLDQLSLSLTTQLQKHSELRLKIIAFVD